MAAHYVALLLEVQPRGPHFLAGYSFGGQVAHAMAQILLARGQSIGLLAIIDSPAPGAIASGAAPALDDGQLLMQLVHHELDLSLEAAGLLPEDGGAEHLRRWLDLFKANLRMDHEYSPESSRPLPIALFRASESMAQAPVQPTLGEDLGWGRYSDQTVPVHYVPGNHLTMMRPPHVETLARSLRSAMEERSMLTAAG
jgi:thioesterase domain-containing protein